MKNIVNTNFNNLPFRTSMRTVKSKTKDRHHKEWIWRSYRCYPKYHKKADLILKGSIGKDCDKTLNKIRPLFINKEHTFKEWYISNFDPIYWEWSYYRDSENNIGKYERGSNFPKKVSRDRRFYELRDKLRKEKRESKKQMLNEFYPSIYFNTEKYQFYRLLQGHDLGKPSDIEYYWIENVYEKYAPDEDEQFERVFTWFNSHIRLRKEYPDKHRIQNWERMARQPIRRKCGEILHLKDVRRLQGEELRYRVKEFFYLMNPTKAERDKYLKKFLETKTCKLWEQYIYKKQCHHF